MTDLFELPLVLGDGTTTTLQPWRGQVLLVVNTASRCGFTPQYEGLQALQQALGPRGFSVLAFPCNQFRGQEPGTDAEIGAFCASRFSVSFPVFAKVAVNGAAAHPLFAALKAAQPGLLGTRSIKWNFSKFLIDREGRAVARFAPTTRPAALRGAIEQRL
nr:glutathione peroxidase [Roseomonas sp. 18066]